MKVSFENFIELVKNYNPEEVEVVTRAYLFAKKCHEGQFRHSGEPYIIHPLAVATILADMHADRDTLCAGLLHDVVEDCNITREKIASLFNETIAELVDGVTNLTKVNFEDKTERNFATKRKIILGITKDARIIIIKLADRLHNMLTLQYKSEQKRIEKANETMQFYVPLARYIGAERLRRQLEDLSFHYLNPEAYIETKEKVKTFVDKKREIINEMIFDIHRLLSDEKVPHELKLRIKNVYSVYQRLNMGEDLANLHDFIAIKTLVNDVKECYNVLRIVHSLYIPCNATFKDYIALPKPNMYTSLHSSVFGPDELLVQSQIRTFEMEKINMYGLTAYWDICKGEAGNRMQEVLKEKFHFESSIKAINRIFVSNQEFVNHVQKEILGENIQVYDYNGRLVEIPEGSTIIDFVSFMGEDSLDKLAGAFVNGKPVSFDTILANGDRVHIIMGETYGPKVEWMGDATTIEAQRKIMKKIPNIKGKKKRGVQK